MVEIYRSVRVHLGYRSFGCVYPYMTILKVTGQFGCVCPYIIVPGDFTEELTVTVTLTVIGRYRR